MILRTFLGLVAAAWVFGLWYMYPTIISYESSRGGQLGSLPNEVPSEFNPQPLGPQPIIEPTLLAAVKEFEGFSRKAFWDYRQHSIGYGTRANSPDEEIDEPEGERRLIEALTKAQALVDAMALPLTGGQRAALTSLTFNAGNGWMEQRLGAAVQAGNWREARDIFLRYVHANGERLAGLVRRRKAEALWFEAEVIAAMQQQPLEPTPTPKAKPVKQIAQQDADAEREAREERQEKRRLARERERREEAAEERREKQREARQREREKEEKEAREERREKRLAREREEERKEKKTRLAKNDDDDDDDKPRRRKRKDDDD